MLQRITPQVPIFLCLAAMAREAIRYIRHFYFFHLSCHSVTTFWRFLLTPKNKLLQLIHTRKLLSDALSASNISKYRIADAYNVNVCQFQWWMVQQPADFIVFDNVYLMLGWDNSPHWESPTRLISLITTLTHSVMCHQTEEASCVKENQCFSGSPAETFKRYMSVTHTQGIQNPHAPERYKCEKTSIEWEHRYIFYYDGERC